MDPVDGRRCTYVQISDDYSFEYSPEQVKDYWHMFCLPVKPSRAPAVEFSTLACATLGCPFRVHSYPDMGPYCCQRCFKRGSHGSDSHGPDCERNQHHGKTRRAFKWWRSVPGTEIHTLQEERLGPAHVRHQAVGCSVVLCASIGCKFRIHSDPAMGAFCCLKCAERGPTAHGPNCTQALAARCARRAERLWRAALNSEVLDIALKQPSAFPQQPRPQQLALKLKPASKPKLPSRPQPEDERIATCRRTVKSLRSALPSPIEFEVLDSGGVEVWPLPLQEENPLGRLPKGSTVRGSLGRGWLQLDSPPSDIAGGSEAWIVVDQRIAAKRLEVKVWKTFAEAAHIIWKGLHSTGDSVRYAVQWALDEVPAAGEVSIRTPRSLSSLAEVEAFVGGLPAGRDWHFRIVAKTSTAIHEQLWGPWSEAAKGQQLEVEVLAADDSFLDQDGAVRGGCKESGCLAWLRPKAILQERLRRCARCGHADIEHQLLDEATVRQHLRRRNHAFLPMLEKFKVSSDSAELLDWPGDRGTTCGHLDRGDEVSGIVYGDWLRLDNPSARKWLSRAEERLEASLEAKVFCVTCVTGALPPDGHLWVRCTERDVNSAGRRQVLQAIGSRARWSDGSIESAAEATKSIKDVLAGGAGAAAPVFVCGGCQSGAALVVELLGMHSALAPVYVDEAALVSHLVTLLSEEQPMPFPQFRREVLKLVRRWLDEPSHDKARSAGDGCAGRAPVDREFAMRMVLHFLDEVRVGTPAEKALGKLCGRLFTELARLGGKAGVVCEGPARGRFLHALAVMYPRLRVVHCVRDGRDVACSRQQLLGGSMGGAAVAWASKVEQVTAWGLGSPSQYVQLRYEDLLDNPAEELSRLLRFLKLPDEPLLKNRRGDVAEGAWCIGDWRKLPKEEVQAFGIGKVFAAMRHFGYPHKQLPITMDQKDTAQKLLQKVRSRKCAEPVNLVGPLHSQPGKVAVVRTAMRTNERLSADKALRLVRGQLQENQAYVLLRPKERFQTLIGFGGAFSESAAEVLSKLSPHKQDQVIGAYFRTDVGLGYELGRVPMTSSDFSPEGKWTCCDKPSDESLDGFSIDRYRKAILPMLRRARDAVKDCGGGPFKLMASPWSPPAWMTSTGTMVKTSLLDNHRGAWAHYFFRFADAFAAEGLPLWAVTVQNEPGNENGRWETCVYKPEEERDFIRDYLGPALQDAPSLDTGDGAVGPRLLFLDHNRADIKERPQVIYKDRLAERYVWGMAFHWYDFYSADRPMHEAVQHVHALRPEKHLVQTEASIEGFKPEEFGLWSHGEKYAREIIGDLNHMTEAWIDWNLLLDERGGPNHAGNFCHALIHADTSSDTLMFQPSYYYMGHFSRYLRPGAVGMFCESSDPNLSITAFENPDGTTALVVLNEWEQPVTFQLAVEDSNHYIKTWAWAPERSITTFILPPRETVPYAQEPSGG